METETATTNEAIEVESPTTDEPATEEVPKPKPKLHRGFAAMNKEAHRELARSGGVAAHALGLAHSFTSEEGRAAGKKGGATTSANREHMAAIGRMGGIAKGQRARDRASPPKATATRTKKNTQKITDKNIVKNTEEKTS
jgi:general stress protein YciG